ncbi:MAG: hypothetical protein ACRCY3_13525 [Sphingorhabdus sp.]
MLISVLAASAAIAAPAPVQQNNSAETCSAAVIAVSVDLKPEAKGLRPEGRLPFAKPENRDPAQALPDCRQEPVKRRKRKSDYPMA